MILDYSQGKIKALILDIDGTLIRGNEAIPGIVELFKFLSSQKLHFSIVSNNSTKSSIDYQRKLWGFGVEVEASTIITAGMATAIYLKNELSPGSKLFVIGEKALEDELMNAGFFIVQDLDPSIKAVVVGGDSNLTYKKLKNAALLLQKGARFVGTNPDLLYPTEEGLIPEAGTTLAALQAATGVTPMVIGKPYPTLFDMAVLLMGVTPSQTAIVGDRLETDILGGQRAGLTTILTTTGVDNRESASQKGIHPDKIVDGLYSLVNLLRNSGDN